METTCTIKGIVIGSRERTLVKEKVIVRSGERDRMGWDCSLMDLQVDTVKSSPLLAF